MSDSKQTDLTSSPFFQHIRSLNKEELDNMIAQWRQSPAPEFPLPLPISAPVSVDRANFDADGNPLELVTTGASKLSINDEEKKVVSPKKASSPIPIPPRAVTPPKREPTPPVSVRSASPQPQPQPRPEVPPLHLPQQMFSQPVYGQPPMPQASYPLPHQHAFHPPQPQPQPQPMYYGYQHGPQPMPQQPAYSPSAMYDPQQPGDSVRSYSYYDPQPSERGPQPRAARPYGPLELDPKQKRPIVEPELSDDEGSDEGDQSEIDVNKLVEDLKQCKIDLAKCRAPPKPFNLSKNDAEDLCIDAPVKLVDKRNSRRFVKEADANLQKFKNLVDAQIAQAEAKLNAALAAVRAIAEVKDEANKLIKKKAQVDELSAAYALWRTCAKN